MADDLQAALVEAHNAGDEDTAIKIAQMIAAQQQQPTAHTAATNTRYDPTEGMSSYDKFMAGAGKSFVDTGHGIKQLVDMGADALSPRSQTLSGQIDPRTRLQMDQQQEDERRQLDQPLMHTGAGIAGDISGQVAQTLLPGGIAKYGISKIANPGVLQGMQALYRVGSNPLVAGAAMGALDPTATGESHTMNAAKGTLGGAIGSRVGQGLNYIARTGEDALSRGARIASDIADKYGVKMSLPDLANSKFVKYINSVTGEMPFSGAEPRREAQRGQFNDALGNVTGIDTGGEGVNMENWAEGRKNVGQQIGGMAAATNGYLTPDIFNNIQGVVADADTHATKEVAGQVRSYVNSMFDKLQPVSNPLPGGPIATVPGAVWREENTALGNHLASLGDNEGDLSRRLSQLHGSYMDMIERGMPPEDVDAFRALRGQYSNLMTLQPLAKKAGTAGIDPKLLMSTANTADNAYWANGTMKPLGELGTLGKERMTTQVPNSGTPIRHLLMATGLGTVAGLGAHHEGASGEESTGIGAAVPLATMIAGGLGNRALNSRLLSKYASARLPEWAGVPVQAATNTAPQIGAATANVMDQGQAEGGKVRSSFWDLMKGTPAQ